jgi:hypothetical protein
VPRKVVISCGCKVPSRIYVPSCNRKNSICVLQHCARPAPPVAMTYMPTHLAVREVDVEAHAGCHAEGHIREQPHAQGPKTACESCTRDHLLPWQACSAIKAHLYEPSTMPHQAATHWDVIKPVGKLPSCSCEPSTAGRTCGRKEFSTTRRASKNGGHSCIPFPQARSFSPIRGL